MSRRREIGSASARSLLLTVLGEFALPRGEPVWTATVLDALGRLEVEQRAARQALARTSAEGLLSSARHGRRTAWELTEHGTRLLTEGTARIYGFMRQPHAWDGRWLVLTVSIPESQRRLRHRLRTQLTWLGLGSPYSGLWISPNVDKADEVHRVVVDLGLEGQSFAWVGPTAGIGEESRLVEAAWDLEDVEKRYLRFLDAFEGRRAGSAGEAFAAQVELVQEWRRFPSLDPDLPRELLDHAWPGHRAAAVFHDRHALWHRRAQQEWDRLQREASDRS
ncbi:MAG TPA: PaaX family transcriptional regulator C-terminal domain-containing protein [Nocardioides sp.]|uniref:PaaX family transcriptional regulator n=1 Tax=Nocardioides sp. TaxID=35761 RepID=UPI002E30CD85|nr:PaaX family transcriptional regulator C-terminal domain-containing protein [Nocardioides sp.]HEX5090314.1 PaaX family transcriptional regulator C-terminal domain-containing protein [Nocardioides sp.]